jgi:hypothetical protein
VRGVSSVVERSSSDLCISLSERWESSSKRFREVNGDKVPDWDTSSVKWVHFLFLIVCHVWWGRVAGLRSRGPCDWGGGVIERARRWGDWGECKGGERERVIGGEVVTRGLTFDGESMEPDARGELCVDDVVAELECRWGAMRGGDRGLG